MGFLPTARLTDQISHGGEIITGSPDTFTNGLPTARIGDLAACSIHGTVKIVTGAPSTFTNGRATARVTDLCSCGASIVTGSPDRFIGNNVAAANPPEASNLFTKPADAPVKLNKATEEANNKKLASYVSNPNGSKNPNPALAKAQAEGGVKENYPGTPDTTGLIDQEPPKKCEPDHTATVIPFLQKCLAEAARGAWRETGQGGAPSNPNIVGIWKTLGFPSSGIWASDQTAWCAGFVHFALKESGLPYLKEAGARQTIARAGEIKMEKIAIKDMQPGDIVLWSYSHVNFCYTANGGKYTFVGGNQTPDDKTKTNNPSDGSITVSWKSGWTQDKGQIVAVIRPKCT